MTAPAEPSPSLAESSRVEAFSAGVLAIALTLLVLGLRSDASRGEFAHDLAAQWPAYVAYLAAFLNIASIWVNHHDLFSRVSLVDAPVIMINLGLLLVASLFPWPAAVVGAAVRSGNHHDQVVAAILYAGVGFFVPFAFIAVYRYLANHPALLREPADVAYCRTGSRRAVTSVVLYPVAALIALVTPVAALAIFVALPAYFIATVVGPRRRR